MADSVSDEKIKLRSKMETGLELESNNALVSYILNLAEQTGIPLKMETLMLFLSQMCTMNCGKMWQALFNHYPLFLINRVINAAKKWVQQNCPEKEDEVAKPNANKVIVAKPNATQVFFTTVKHKKQWTQGGCGRKQNNPA